MTKERPSLYLEQKCEGLQTVLEFFDSSKNGYERPMVFLRQIDFWEWEVENLIYSFESFVERSKAWNATGDMAVQLGSKGIIVRPKVADKFETARFLQSYEKNSDKNSVVAPWEQLKVVVDKWNRLLDLCEKKVMVSEKAVKTAQHFGWPAVLNLDNYRKKIKEIYL